LGFKRNAGESELLEWYGFQRGNKARNFSDEEIKKSKIYNNKILKKFAQRGKVITVDNQYLSFGYGRMKWWTQPNAQKYT